MHISEFDAHTQDKQAKPPLDPHLKALENEGDPHISAKWPPSSSARSCSIRSARIPPCCCIWRARLSIRDAFPSRCCMSIPAGSSRNDRLPRRDGKRFDLDLVVHTNPRGLKENTRAFTHGSSLHTDIMKTEALRQALDAGQYDAAFGGRAP